MKFGLNLFRNSVQDHLFTSCRLFLVLKLEEAAALLVADVNVSATNENSCKCKL